MPSSLSRALAARLTVAQLIAGGEHWLLPLFKRLTQDVAELEEQEALLQQVAEILRCSKTSGD